MQGLTYAELIGKFSEPPSENRSVPFWSWNGKLEQAELDAQVEGFKEQGMGGFMMHVREGLETPYLGEEFMERIKDTVAKAKAEGLHAWLYDEDKYSSGMGGGMVPRIGGDAVRAKALSLTVCRSFDRTDDSVLAVYHVRVSGDGNELLSCVRLKEMDADARGVSGDEVYLVMRRHVAARNEWCHGETYPDHLNPESTAIFLETTYERYKSAVGEEFGRTIPGIFTDEPSILGFKEGLDQPEMTWIPWSDTLPKTFADKCGYEIWDRLPYFFYHGRPSSKIRFDFWKTVTEQFCESYSKQIGDWCRENGLAFTGHFCEVDVVGATRHCGAVMPNYRYLDIPGIDTLCEQTDESLTVKQVSSVANQYGKKRVITETYGVTGWDFSFEGRKWIGDWQFALGVNLLTHHLALYSLRGCRKRDYPPSFNYNVNWWEHNRVMEDYFARLGAVLSEGSVVRDVLVLHRATSVWAMLGQDVKAEDWLNQGGNNEALGRYDQEFNDFVRRLLGEHYDFDLGDELILQEVGSVDGGRLRVGEADYRVVVLPSLVNLLGTTLELLLDYLNEGGCVLSYGTVPTLLDGEAAEERLREMIRHPRFTHLAAVDGLIEELEAGLSRSVSLTLPEGRQADRLLYMRRELPDCTVVFVVNNDRENAYDVEVRIQGSGRLESWDALTGEKAEVSVVSRDGSVVFHKRFGPAESKLYVLSGADRTAGTIRREADGLTPTADSALGLGEPVSFGRTAPNALVLDRCQYRFGDEAWSESMEVWQAQKNVREKLGMRQVYANGNLQRHFWVHEPHEKDGKPVDFRFVFQVKDIPATDTFVVFEQAERFRFRLNGVPIVEGPQGWYLDRCMATVKLPVPALGENVLEISCEYTHDMEIEDAFLIGDFAVDGSRCLIKEPGKLRFGDWCLQGYPHYCGSMIFHFDLEADLMDGHSIVMELGPYEAVTLNFRINGSRWKPIPWRAAGTVDLTDGLNQGMNRIEVEVVGSPRNLLGPLHAARSDSSWIDWWSFHSTGEEHTEEYVLRPYGLMGEIRIYSRGG
ncbi:glycosyl hydrolase [Cohnella suwonensis]|uniref:Glycosyl hydrolase n=1 Tax=Cohnella suwonensis TaxID=696072 RepID=A0ABW0LPS8_9BACL